MRRLATILLLAVGIFICTCFVRTDFVTAGALLDPPEPGGSNFIEAYGFPLPVYAQNYDPMLGPTGWKIFWKAVYFTYALSLLVSTILTFAVILVRGMIIFRTRIIKSRAS